MTISIRKETLFLKHRKIKVKERTNKNRTYLVEKVCPTTPPHTLATILTKQKIITLCIIPLQT